MCVFTYTAQAVPFTWHPVEGSSTLHVEIHHFSDITHIVSSPAVRRGDLLGASILSTLRTLCSDSEGRKRTKNWLLWSLYRCLVLMTCLCLEEIQVCIWFAKNVHPSCCDFSSSVVPHLKASLYL